MPELPEVETIASELNHSSIIGQSVCKVEIFWPKIVGPHVVDDFQKQLIGRVIHHVYRRAKFIVLQLDKGKLIVHLRMTGKIFVNESLHIPHKHEHLRITLANGQVLHYEDQRKFGRWKLVSSEEDPFSAFGIEPLSDEFTLQILQDMLLTHSTAIKPFLLNQKYIVGLGNIYVDEALWEAKIHPLTQTNKLRKTEVILLHKAIINVLQKGIQNRGTSLGKHKGNYYSTSGEKGGNQQHLQVFKRQGLPCYRCNDTILKIRVAQRGTHYCPSCQQERL